MNSGQKANRTGNLLEQYIENALKGKGYTEFWNYKATAFDNRNALGGKQFL